ncbi:MAG: phosphoglycerate dehydrogenase, partial [Mesorhizobium sp.]
VATYAGETGLIPFLNATDILVVLLPLTAQTHGIINYGVLKELRKRNGLGGSVLINAGRGKLQKDADILRALEDGTLKEASLDVFEVEPAEKSELFGMENVVATPHLGASTMEAQENVALQVAEQMADYLIKGAVSNAINMPSITAEEAPRLKPFVKLAEVLGAFVGQVTEDPIKEVEILFDGSTATMNTRALISATLAGLIRPQVSDVNMVSAPIMVKERGIIVAEVKRDKSGVFDGYIKLTVKTEHK